MSWVERDLKDHQVPIPCHRQCCQPPQLILRLSRVPSNMALNTSRDRASTTSLGSLFQYLTTLSVNNFLLITYLIKYMGCRSFIQRKLFKAFI